MRIDVAAALSVLILISCKREEERAETREDTPTAGHLTVCYDEGLELHVRNQAYTFEALYPNVSLTLKRTSENDAVQALLDDSCGAIVISRPLGEQEKKQFASRQYFPRHSEVAKSGIVVITSRKNALTALSLEELRDCAGKGSALRDSSGRSFLPRIVFDRDNSSALHYVRDSLLGGGKLSGLCSALEGSGEAINYVAANENAIAILDFAWLSDVDDSLRKANSRLLRFVGISRRSGEPAELPSQSSFKLGTYPLTRTVCIYRKTGDFTLAKGFESFVAGPKGQVIFLKQGLLPTRQQERRVNVTMSGAQQP